MPHWQGRVSPVFDVARHMLLVDLDEEGENGRRTEVLDITEPHGRARRLGEMHVDVLVCGAISAVLEGLIAAQGIRVIPLICGDVDEVIRAIQAGTLEDGRFAMPGCCRKQKKARNRHRRGGGPQTEEFE